VPVASIFSAFGSQVQLFQAAPRIPPTEDVVAVRWVANTGGLNLATAGVETDPRGFRSLET
jgi:hypothetical protein